MNVKLLITGGAGFIGSNFVKYWLKNHIDDEVVVLDALTYAGRLSNLREVKNLARYKFIKGNICDKQTVLKAAAGVDTLVHFAAESHVDRSITGPGQFVRTNIWGTYTLLEAVRALNIRMHHISTDEVFGSLDRNSTKKFTIDTAYNPHSPYAASKASSDHLVRSYIDTYGIRATISNCSNNYGPNHFPEKLIPLAITNLIEGKKVPVYGDGGQIRDWLYVEDHCRAIELILEKGVIGNTYLIGGLKKDVTNLELIKMIIKVMGKSENQIEYVKDRLGHDQKYAVDWTTMEALGWKPSVTLQEGLERTIEWYVKNQNWWRQIKK